MHKNMQKLYESIGSYFAFDPHSVSVEDFFGELANFRILFMVSIYFIYVIFTVLSKYTQTNRSHHPHMHSFAYTFSCLYTLDVIEMRTEFVLNMHTFP